MAKIRNLLNQKLIIMNKGGKTFDLMAKATIDVSDSQLSSSHLKKLIEKGDIQLLETSKKEIEEPEGEENPKKNKKKLLKNNKE